MQLQDLSELMRSCDKKTWPLESQEAVMRKLSIR